LWIFEIWSWQNHSCYGILHLIFGRPIKQRHFQYKAEFIVVYNVVSLYKIGTFIYLSDCYKEPTFL
jgi:surface polysaccharide O-acyltransferase-like enzyme